MPLAHAKRLHFSNHHHQNAQPQIISWGSSNFYQSNNGLLFANHYTKQTIHDFASLLHHKGIHQITFIPMGQQGAIPHHLRDYAFWKLAEYGVTVLHYTPSSGIIYWGQSAFYQDHAGRIYATHYTHQTIHDLARLHHALGYHSVTLIPYGQVGAIPNHLRAKTIQRFNQYGIQVHAYTNQKTYTSKKSKQHKAKPEKIFMDLLIDLLDKD